MKRKRFQPILWTFLVVALGAGLFAPSRPIPEASAAGLAPNIVVVMVDDLDLNVLNAALSTPNVMTNFLQLFGTAGTGPAVTFDQSFVSDSVCCPSRATFLTGLYAHNHQVTQEDCHQLTATTLATRLQGAPIPYYTGVVGRWLNGYGTTPGDLPTQCGNKAYVAPGWNEWHVMPGVANDQGSGYVDPQLMWNYWVNNTVAPGSPSYQFFDNTLQSNYQTQIMSNKATTFIHDAVSQHGGQRFFLWVTPTAPHLENSTRDGLISPACEFNSPFGHGYKVRVPSGYFVPTGPLPTKDSYNKAIGNAPGFFSYIHSITDTGCITTSYNSQLSSMKAIDQLIGAVATQLITDNVFNKTVIVFTSDNGFFHGEHMLLNKDLPYEESIRVPLVVRDPRCIAPGCIPPTYEDQNDFVVNTDLAPTILTLANVCPGAGCPAMDGQSLVPFLEGPAPSIWRKQFLVEHWLPGTLSPDTALPYPTYTGVRTANRNGDSYGNSLFVAYQNTTSPDHEYYVSLNGCVTPGTCEETNLWQDASWCTGNIGCNGLAGLLSNLQTCGEPLMMTCWVAETADPP